MMGNNPKKKESTGPEGEDCEANPKVYIPIQTSGSAGEWSCK